MCNKRNKKWCPYGEENCFCDYHDPVELKEDDNMKFVCINKNYHNKKCQLVEYEKYKIENRLLQSGFKKHEINAFYILIQKGMTPDIYEKYYRMVNEQ